MKRVIIIITSMFCTMQAYSWSNNFRIINNLSEPIKVSVAPNQGGAHSSCDNGKTPNNLTIKPHSNSCTINITTTFGISRGKIMIRKANQTLCKKYHYNDRTHLKHTDKYSLDFSDTTCNSGIKGNSFTVLRDNPNTEYYAQLDKDVLAPMGALKLRPGMHPINLAIANCSGFDKGKYNIGPKNCLIVTPNANDVINSLKQQDDIDRYEPLNKAQFLGTHNSTISKVYTGSRFLSNMSYSDPNHNLSIIQQLTQGVRSIELDFRYDKSYKICHNQMTLPAVIRDIINYMTCDGNTQLKTALNEIKLWVDENPNSLVIVYLDVNGRISGHQNGLVSLIKQAFGSKVLNKDDLNTLFDTNNMIAKSIGLPLDKLTKDKLNKKGKNIIVMSHSLDLADNLYVFVKPSGNNKIKLPYDMGTSHFIKKINAENRSDDSLTIFKKLFNEDENHQSIWRFNGDRTVISYLNSSESENTYNDSITLAVVKQIMQYPLNMISMDRLGGTYGVNDKNKALDPRLALWLWSWDVGFPLENGQNIAYLDAKTKHFKNDKPIQEVTYSLCHSKTKKPYWATVPIISKNGAPINSSQDACVNLGQSWQFAVPVTSSMMSQVTNYLASKQLNYPILVNYIKKDAVWQANGGKSIS
jgi:Phosphatidylinositol-specific phospholipase C, X domain